MGRGWVPTNYKSKSASKDRDVPVFKYKKKGAKKESAAKGIQPFKGINKLK